jgi:indole-3-acetate monooxygenase
VTTDAPAVMSADGSVDELLARIDSSRLVLEGAAFEAEQLRTLPPAVADALHDMGIYALRVPRELGGLGADSLTQMKVFETIAAANPSAGWCAFVGAGAANVVSGRLPDKSLARVFVPGTPAAFTGALAFTGKAIAADGGWTISGRWPYVSGVRHCDWLFLNCRVVDSAQPRTALVSRGEIDILDDWSTAGLQGTGSNTVVAGNVFVPDEMTWNPTAPAVRGGHLTEMGVGGNLAPALCGFCLGVTDRAIREVLSVARTKKRGASPDALAQRSAFLLEAGRQITRVDAARALAVQRLRAAWDIARQHGRLPADHQQGLLALSAFCAESSVEAVQALWPFLGASELGVENVVQRCLRDLLCASQHLYASNVAYEAHARELLDADPLPT